MATDRDTNDLRVSDRSINDEKAMAIHGEEGGYSEDYLKYISAGLSADDAQFLASVPTKEQDRIFRKVDWHLVPYLAILYLIAHLDRANIGNAKISGLEESLNMTDVDYNIAVGVFFIPYVLCEVPSNYFLSKFSRPSWYVGTLVRLTSFSIHWSSSNDSIR